MVEVQWFTFEGKISVSAWCIVLATLALTSVHKNLLYFLNFCRINLLDLLFKDIWINPIIEAYNFYTRDLLINKIKISWSWCFITGGIYEDLHTSTLFFNYVCIKYIKTCICVDTHTKDAEIYI